jgi:hypothetical protein
MKISLLQKTIIISFFVALAIIGDILSEIIYFSFPTFGLKILKFNFVVLFLSGFFLGFRKSFIVCLFYSFFHILKFFLYKIQKLQLFNLNLKDYFLTSLLDYILPDLIVSISGIGIIKKDINNKLNSTIKYKKKNILQKMLIISILRTLLFLTSSYYVYFDKVYFLKNINFFSYFALHEKNLLFACFCFWFVHNLINFITSSLLIIQFLSKWKWENNKYFK